ncbi:hypothetical protein BO85DRAFT_89189 [Aspergillus piperis CBS 112811]|uniref:Uncharacterized protein n=1 Tax=Aspergillus piperis CBS 112811 TaxID=1448313 RepID=A0A8G1QWJ5_9EURO|nr:hypothetical protein BO85DRAFT_89189 [Aspergillus piperis CBS 112811]RAH54984.1 hypothetical protein BO85DRAFT_89189 [Aspergillus piperis CBS 112811]
MFFIFVFFTIWLIYFCLETSILSRTYPLARICLHLHLCHYSVPVLPCFPLFMEHLLESLCINLMCVDRAASRGKHYWQTTWKTRDHTVSRLIVAFLFSFPSLLLFFLICRCFSDYYFFTPHSALFPPTNTLFDPPPGPLCAVSGEMGWSNSTDKAPIHKGPCQVLRPASNRGFPPPHGLPRFFFDVRPRQDGIFVPSRYLACLSVHADMCL